GELSVGSLLQRHEVIAEHQLDRNFLKQLVMQFEAAEVDEFAAITPSHVLCALQVGNGIAGGADWPAITAIHEQRFFVGCRHFRFFYLCPRFKTLLASPPALSFLPKGGIC